MKFEELQLPGVFLITPKRFGDDRGFFSETWKQAEFEAAVGPFQFVQDNHAATEKAGTVRGLHFQAPPMAQGKLVSVTKGRVLDVVVDIRKSSPTYGQHMSVELSRDNWQQLWVPPGFAHCYCTLEADTDFTYKVTAPYSPADEGGLRFDDPALGIDWPFPVDEMYLSERDRIWQGFNDFDSPFTYEG